MATIVTFISCLTFGSVVLSPKKEGCYQHSSFLVLFDKRGGAPHLAPISPKSTQPPVRRFLNFSLSAWLIKTSVCIPFWSKKLRFKALVHNMYIMHKYSVEKV